MMKWENEEKCEKIRDNKKRHIKKERFWISLKRGKAKQNLGRD